MEHPNIDFIKYSEMYAYQIYSNISIKLLQTKFVLTQILRITHNLFLSSFHSIELSLFWSMFEIQKKISVYLL